MWNEGTGNGRRQSRRGVFQQIINQILPHAVFIEGFLGKGAVLRNKRVAERTIGIELDAQVIAEHWRGDEVPNQENRLWRRAGLPAQLFLAWR